MQNYILKLISLLLIAAFSLQSAYALPVYTDCIDSDYVKSKNSQKIEFVMPVFEDDTAALLPSDLKKPKYISKKFVDKAFVNAISVNSTKKVFVPTTFKDTPVKFNDEDKYFVKPVFSGRINVDGLVPVKVSPCELIKPVNEYVSFQLNGRTCAALQETPLIGTRVKFKIKEDVYVAGKLFIKADTDAYAVIGRSVPAMLGGSSGEIQVDRFRTFDVDGNIVKLDGVIQKEGFSTGRLVSVVGALLAPFTLGTSTMLVFFVPGTSGTVKPNIVYTLYYNPDSAKKDLL